MLGPVSAWMGDHLRAGKLSQYVTSHPGQLSLAIPLWVSTMSTSLGWEGNCRSAQVTWIRPHFDVIPGRVRVMLGSAIPGRNRVVARYPSHH